MPAISVNRAAFLVAGMAAVVGCSGQQRSAAPAGGPPTPFSPAARGNGLAQPVDPSSIYNQMGLIATGSPLSYVGKIAYFAGASPDTTLVLASVSIPNRVLSFVRDGDTYRAPYEVRLKLNRGPTEVKSIDALEIVRVASFKEVTRTDESVIFQNYFRVPPGDYTISFYVRDAASNRSATQEGAIVVPRMKSGQLSTPVIVYQATPRSFLDSVPKILASPRSSAVFGQDSTVTVYLEAYGEQPRLPVSFVVQNDKGAVTWRDTTVLERRGALLSRLVNIPISRVGIGIANVTFTRMDATDTVRTPVFVSFGNDIPLISYEELLNELRYYVAPDRLKALRDVPVEQRGAAWAEFLRSTDPSPATPEHEGLETYFARLQQAALRFREDGGGRSGFLSDRARVYVVLGEPDQLYEQNTNGAITSTSLSQRGRLQYWDYNQYGVRLIFYDDSGTGRWRLTPISETDFANLNARLLVH
jgi:GWxTD domain-containing protein